MSLDRLINRPCTIVRRLPSADEDGYGNEIPAEQSIETVCELQRRMQRTGDERGDQGELSDTVWSVFFLPGETVHTGDVVIVDGAEYELVGRPWRVRNPRTQVVSHVEATLRQTAGAHEEGS